jgi:AcrR family transcriptional regulator
MLCRHACPTCATLRSGALEIVGREGIEALTIERLGYQAGLTPDEVRAHYPSAADCLSESYEEVSRSIRDDFAAAFAAEARWRDALTTAARRLLERMAARPEEARLCFQEVLRGDHELLRRRDEARRKMVDLFVGELGRRKGNWRVPRTQLELLIGAGFQDIAAAVAEGRVVGLPELLPELTSRANVFEPAEPIVVA